MIYDINTKNKSFLRISKVLRDRGVKNNKFMLQLFDPGLVGIDPFDPKLTNAQKIAIFKECSINVWYYIREVVRLAVEGKPEGLKYKLNLGNLALSYIKSKNRNQFTILPRQFGKTMGEIIYDTWIMLFAATNTNIIYSNKERKDSVKNLKSFKDIKENLPAWLTGFISSKNDKDNEEYKLIANRNNTLKAISAATSDEQAEKLGRGMTTSNIYFDEFAFLARNEKIFLAARPAWVTASENARKNGTPYGITITTTPNNVDTKQGEYAKLFMDNAAPWLFECYDMTDKQLADYLEKNSKNKFFKVQYSVYDLGKDDAWLKEQLAGSNDNWRNLKREYLLEWPRSVDTAVFSEEQIEKLYQFIKKPLTKINVNNYFIEFYEQPDFSTNYIIGVDVAGGLSRDSTAITFISPDNFRVVGHFRSNSIDTDNTTKLIENLMKIYFRNAILIIERNSYGLNIIQRLMKDTMIEPRMVREEREILGEKKQQDGFTVKKKMKTLIYGVDTNVKTRKEMFDLLPGIVEFEYEKIASEEIVKDIAGLETKSSGKVEHSSASHDDGLMSYLLFRWSLHFGRNLREKFKISPIPSPSNIKIVASSDDIKKIEGIIRDANIAASQNTENIAMFGALAAQQEKINRGIYNGPKDSEDEKSAYNSFMNILDLNRNN
jgi:hypothetical protein